MKVTKTTPSGAGGAINIVVGGVNQPITFDPVNPANDVPLPVQQIGRIQAHFILDNTSGTISTAAYTQLVAATGQYWNEIEIDNGPQVIFIVAFGAAGVEVDQFFLAPSGFKRQTIAIPAGTRISLKAIGQAATGGYILLNAFA